MLKSITFLQNHRCFKKNKKLQFQPGINLLVGEQGCGKSTILSLLNENGRYNSEKPVIEIEATHIKTRYLDFERNNPRTKSYFGGDGLSVADQVSLMFVSHGQSNNAILRGLGSKDAAGVLFMLDEPDMALSIRSCYELANLFQKAVKNGCQILAAVHNPILITSVPKVLSLEHGKWMTSDAFVRSHSPAKA